MSGEVGGRPPDHLSLYGLIVEPGTPMADAVQRGILAPVDDDTAADFYELAMAMLADAGWIHYEIANWASSPRYGLAPQRRLLAQWRLCRDRRRRSWPCAKPPHDEPTVAGALHR